MFLLSKRLLILGCIAIISCIGCSISPSKHATSVGLLSDTNAFAPTFVSNEEDKFIDALEIYESSPSVPQGIYKYDKLVYVVVVIDTTKENIRYLEGTAMLRAKAILQNEYPSLPKNFRLRNRLVEKTFDNNTGLYRYAVVLRQQDISKGIETGDRQQ